MTTTQIRFLKDMSALNAEFAEIGAIVTDPSDGWIGIDPSKASPSMIKLYSDMTSIGYANGWL